MVVLLGSLLKVCSLLSKEWLLYFDHVVQSLSILLLFIIYLFLCV